MLCSCSWVTTIRPDCQSRKKHCDPRLRQHNVYRIHLSGCVVLHIALRAALARTAVMEIAGQKSWRISSLIPRVYDKMGLT